jgi:hypothetical protein
MSVPQAFEYRAAHARKARQKRLRVMHVEGPGVCWGCGGECQDRRVDVRGGLLKGSEKRQGG